MLNRNWRMLTLVSVACCCAVTAGCGGSAVSADAQRGGSGGSAGANAPVAGRGGDTQPSAGSGGDTQPSAGSGGDTQPSAGSGGDTQPSAGSGPSVAAMGYEKLRFEVIGGYGPAPCDNGKDSYEVTRATRHLAWVGCDYTTTPAGPLMGERTLSEAEAQAVTEGLARVSLSSTLSCGADASVLRLDLTTSSSTKYYADDFYSECPWELQAGRTFVSGLGHLNRVLWELARQ